MDLMTNPTKSIDDHHAELHCIAGRLPSTLFMLLPRPSKVHAAKTAAPLPSTAGEGESFEAKTSILPVYDDKMSL